MKQILFLCFALCAIKPAFPMQPTKTLEMDLITAAFEGNSQVCKKLIQERANVNEQGGQSKRTPLHYAAAGGHAGPCSQLIAAGANINMFDNGVQTPLLLAISRNHPDAVKAILTTPLPREFKKMKANRCGLIAIRYAKPTLPLDIRRLIDQLIINSFAQDHINRIKEMLTILPHNVAKPVAETMKHTEIAQLLDIDNPQIALVLLKEIKPLIRRLLIPKLMLTLPAANPGPEIQNPDATELPNEAEEFSDENTDEQDPWEFL